MGNDGNGGGRRVSDLYDHIPSGQRGLPQDLTPDEARALIDGVFRSHGIDPHEATDDFGWRSLSVGSAHGYVGVVEWQPGEYHLLVLAPVLTLPAVATEQLAEFYRLLLETNHDGTLSARFSLHDGTVYASLSRHIRGLSQEEVDDAIHTVMLVADGYDERLQEALEILLGSAPLPMGEMPNIKMTPREAQTVAAVLVECDAHGRELFRYLLERWQKMGYVVAPGTSGIGLQIPVGNKQYSLAGVRAGVGERRQLLILEWQGLRRQKAFPPKAIDRFQAAVQRIATLYVTESTAHIEVTEAFDQESAKALLQALRTLATAVDPALIGDEKTEWDPSLPKLEIQMGSKTMAGIQETLLACAARIQGIFATLIAGWSQAGGTVHCNRPGRIYLRLQTREHNFGEHGVQSHQFNLAVLAAPKGKRGPAIDVAWGLATGTSAYLDYVADAVACFESTVSGLPGFERTGAVTRLVVQDAFQEVHAQELLAAMLELKAAGGKDANYPTI